MLRLLLLFIMVSSLEAIVPKVDIPDLGEIHGKEIKTVGNLGKPQRPYYTFRNIPYGELSNGRFSQPVMYEKLLPTQPYDASITGPLCPQGTLDGQAIDEVLLMPMEELVTQALEAANVSTTLLPPKFVLEIMEAVFKTQFSGLTAGQVLENWLDMKITVSEEDCLHLAVSTLNVPEQPVETGGLPVMVFIHGGGFSSGTQIKMGPERLGDVADIVLVSINYRVGILGFMCLDDENAAGNMGMLDMVLALQWVQKYVKYFGGDANQVTIFGESAGSAAIGHLLVSHLAKDLFHRAIGQSGSAISPWAFDMEPEVHVRGVAEKVGCNSDQLGHLISCMKSKSYVQVTKAFSTYSAEGRANGTLGFGGTIPCSQTKGFPQFYHSGQHPEEMLLNGDYDKLPIFFGANRHEGSYVYGVVHRDFIKPNNKDEDIEFLTWEFTEFLLSTVGITQGYAFSDHITEKYFRPWQLGDLALMTPGAVDALGVFFIKASGYKMVEDNARHGADSYWYSIEHESNKSVFHMLFITQKPPDVTPGVCHADELMYLFHLDLPILLCPINNLLDALKEDMLKCLTNATCYGSPSSTLVTKYAECLDGHLTQQEQIWSDNIVRAWTNFATTGKPSPDENDPHLPHLEPWTRRKPVYMKFGPDNVTIEENYKLTYTSIMEETLTTTTSTGTTTITTDPEMTTEEAGGNSANAAKLSAWTVIAIIIFVTH